MGKKGSGGGGSGRGRSSSRTSSYSPALNTAGRSIGGHARRAQAARQQPTIDEMVRHQSAARSKGKTKLKPLGKADSHLIKQAKAAKKPSKAHRELQHAVGVRKTLARLHRKASRSS